MLSPHFDSSYAKVWGEPMFHYLTRLSLDELSLSFELELKNELERLELELELPFEFI
jgi:hypothetical protein